MCMVPPPLTSPIELVKLLGYFASDYTRYFPLPKTLFYSKDEIHHFEKMLDFQRKRMAYFQIQSTEPDRLGVGLNDSPVGLLAWIGVIVSAASSNRITNEEVLINCSIFWFTKTISSSMRLYKEEKDLSKRVDYVSVPTGVAIFPEELGCSPKSWAKVHMNIKSWNYLNKGGHFAAFGVPEIFVEEIHQGEGFLESYGIPDSEYFSKSEKLGGPSFQVAFMIQFIRRLLVLIFFLESKTWSPTLNG
ncbi:epoxide hydrolase [Clydaea vesicula]|uniref:Epoxide hydrolase n=1 Tax=Clydaea vesicula TaxID=447962 RepID=A0AAD5TZK2_9FUNG|nr:epoxide hydrolase [Clydaea vesicula]